MTQSVLDRPIERRPYEPRGAARQCWRSARPEVLSCGPADCIAGETRIYDPVQDKHIPIKELYEKQQAPIVQTLWGPVQAEIPFRKGVDKLYRLTTADGRSCLVTGHHLVLTEYGWAFVSACFVGLSILVSAPYPLPSTEARIQQASQPSVHHSSHISASCQDDCSEDCCQCGVQLQSESSNALTSSPLLSGVPVYTHADLHMGDLADEQEYISHPLSSGLRATLGCSLLSEEGAYTQCCCGLGTSTRGDDSFRCAAQSLQTKPLPSPTGVSHRHVDSTRRPYPHWLEYLLTVAGAVPGSWWPRMLEQLSLYSTFAGMSPEWWSSVLVSDVYSLSLIPSYKFDYTVQWTTVSSIEYERTDEYFDLHVPGAEHYLAEGIWHHNTGKSRGCIEKVHFCMDKYSRARSIMVRKTRESLTQSAMVTYEQKVLPEGWLADSKADQRRHPWRIYFSSENQEYQFPNGSIIAVGGMDKPSKLMSSEWDIIYVPEATELTEEDWEVLSIRKRNGVMPYQQLIADCNPGPPQHWLKARCDRGVTRMFHARFSDNPSFTPEREAILQALTGVRRLRLYEGIWAAAEGMVYKEWNPAVHLVSEKQLKAWEVFYTDGTLNRQVIRHVIGGADWGYSNPGVLQTWGIDSDGRLYLLAEIYRTQRTDDWWIAQAKQLDQEFHIEQWVGDPSQPAYIRKFNEAGLSMLPAENALLPGITVMQSRLQVQGDGRPRLYVYEYALRDRDELRDEAHQPVWFEGEINEYVWPKTKDGQPVKEVPVKVNDHSMDTARYVCMYLDSGGTVHESDRDTAEAIHNFRGY